MEYDWQGVIAATPFPEPFSIYNGHKSANLGLVKHSREKKWKREGGKLGNGTCSYFRSDVYFRSRLDPQSRSRGINRHRRGKKESPRRAIGRDRDIFPPQFCSDLAVETLSWTPYWIISAVNFIFAHEWSCQLPCHHKSLQSLFLSVPTDRIRSIWSVCFAANRKHIRATLFQVLHSARRRIKSTII